MNNCWCGEKGLMHIQCDNARNQTLADVLKIIDKRVNLHRNGDADLELTTWGFGSFIRKLKEEIKNLEVKA